jgi:predicted ribosomally synthesized peptide with SipW-like signal peptide
MKAKSRLLLVALVAILLTVLTQPTLAYYTAYGKATNVVTSGDIQLKIHEKTADGNDFPAEGVYVIPGDIVSKRVSIENVCGHPFYLRVKVVSNSTNQALSADDCLKLDINTADWTFVDGYYYYNKILQPGEVTPALFTQVEIVGSKVDQNHVGSMLSLTVNAYAVQSQNNPAEHPWNAAGWPAD